MLNGAISHDSTCYLRIDICLIWETAKLIETYYNDGFRYSANGSLRWAVIGGCAIWGSYRMGTFPV